MFSGANRIRPEALEFESKEVTVARPEVIWCRACGAPVQPVEPNCTYCLTPAPGLTMVRVPQPGRTVK